MTVIAVGLVLPVAAAFQLLGRECRRPVDWAFALVAAAGLGAGASSLVWYALLSLPFRSLRGPMFADLGLWSLVVIGLAFRRTRADDLGAPLPSRRSPAAMTWIAALSCLVVVAFAVTLFVAISHLMPHGDWDAWAIWNERARYLFRGYPEFWKDGFTPSMGAEHAEYPLMLPMMVARAWAYLGREDTVVPVACAALFSGGVVALAATSLARVDGGVRGCLAAIAILASPSFMRIAPIQYSDVPLGFFMLATFVLLDRATEAPSRRVWWLLTGLSIGVAAWTKNEGMMFVLAAAVPIAVWAVRSGAPRRWSSMAFIGVGMLPALVTVLLFKMTVPHTNEIMASISFRRAIAQFRNSPRMRAIFQFVGLELWFGGATVVGPLPIVGAYTAVAGLRRPLPAAALLGLTTMAIMLAGYVTIYATTPYNLGWHLKTSVDRLVVQLLPTFIWGAFRAARS